MLLNKLKKRKQMYNIYMKELNFLVGCVILKQTSAKGNLITHKEPAHEGTQTV